MKDLLRTQDLSRDDVEMLLSTAAEFAADPLKSRDALAHKSVAIYMTKPSTRTRLASETAVAHLGGTPIFIRGDELQLGRGETIADTARIISGYCSALIVRTFAQADVNELGKHSSIPVINALTDEAFCVRMWVNLVDHERDVSHSTSKRTPKPVPPLGFSPESLSLRAVPAMSKCTHWRSPTNCSRKSAAVTEPAP